MTPPHVCPKCHYIRRDSDTAPAWQCPQCGVVYDKVKTDAAAPRGDGPVNPAARPEKPRNRFKTFRIWVLMLVLVVVALDAWLTKIRTTSWDHPLRVVVYPINADGSEAAARHIAQLNAAQFDGVEAVMRREAARYGVAISEPMHIALAPELKEMPPLPPKGGNVLNVMWWSLKLRLWANRVDEFDGPAPELRAFTLYYDPVTHPVLDHSTGLEKGMIAVIKLFAAKNMTAQNDTVLLHELLHTLGASDKYDPATNLPRYPEGYAEPELQPRLPQRKAEVMGGRIPLSESRAEMPEQLSELLIGPVTAREIGWID